MKKANKTLSMLIALSMTSTMVAVPAHAEFTATVTPADGAKLVSVIDDPVITFSAEPDMDTLADGITITGNPAYTLRKSENTVTIAFDNQLAYETEYTISFANTIKDVNGNALTADDFTFKTEYNPVETLYYNDFDGEAADIYKTFTVNGVELDETNPYYTAVDGKLQLNAATLGTYAPIFKGSENWRWYKAEYTWSAPTARVKTHWMDKAPNNGRVGESFREIIELFYNGIKFIETSSKRIDRGTIATNLPRLGVVSNAAGYTGGNAEVPVVVNFEGVGKESKLSFKFSNTIDNTQLKYGSNNIDVYETYNGGAAAGIYNDEGTATIDNLKVTDTGLFPQAYDGTWTEIQRKNITDTISLALNTTDVSVDTSKISVTTLDGTPIAADITAYAINDNQATAIEITSDKLSPNTMYAVNMAYDSVTANAGEDGSYKKGLSNDKVFTIKTELKEYSVERTVPMQGDTDVSVNESIYISFSNPVDFSTLEDAITIADAPEFVITEENEKTAKITFNERLAYGKTYSVEISNAATTTDGVPFYAYSFGFTTEASTFMATLTPEIGTKSVSVLSDVEVVFNDEVNEATLIKENITVTPEADFVVKAVQTGYILEFVNELAYNTEYTVELGSGIENADGMNINTVKTKFKTEHNPGTALFFEDFTDAVTAMDKFEEVGSANRNESENFYVENGALILPSWYSGATNQADRTVAQIIGSDAWKNFEIEMDVLLPNFQSVATSAGANFEILLRRTVSGTTIRYISSSVADSANNGIIRGGGWRENPNNGSYANYEAFSYAYDPNEWLHVKTSLTGTKGTAEFKQEISGYDQIASVAVKDSELTSAPYVDGTGHVALQTTSRDKPTKVDNLLITDLDFGYTASGIKNNDGSATITFNKPVYTSSLKTGVTVWDGETQVPATISVNADNKSAVVSVNNPQTGKTYIVKVSGDVMSEDGSLKLTEDRNFKMSVKLPFAIRELNIKNASGNVSALNANDSIYAEAYIDYTLESKKEATLFIALYDNDGALEAVKLVKQPLVTNGENKLVTENITLPADVTGYTASAFIWDNLTSMIPIGSDISIKKN